MSLTVFNGSQTLNTLYQMNRTQRGLNTNLARLSSGLRVNGASDDAAALAISERLRSQIRTVSQVERNANDAVSLLQTAEGAVNEIASVLVRMRELAVQSSTGTLTTSERSFLNDEFASIRDEIDRLASATEFNGVVLLSGGLTGLQIQIGIGTTSNDRLTVGISSVRSDNLGAGTKLNAVSITDIAASQTAIGVIDEAINDVSAQRGRVGSYQNRLSVTVSNLASAREGLTAAESRIRDVDVAEESAALTRNNIMMQSQVSVLAQANQLPIMVLDLLR